MDIIVSVNECASMYVQFMCCGIKTYRQAAHNWQIIDFPCGFQFLTYSNFHSLLSSRRKPLHSAPAICHTANTKTRQIQKKGLHLIHGFGQNLKLAHYCHTHQDNNPSAKQPTNITRYRPHTRQTHFTPTHIRAQ